MADYTFILTRSPHVLDIKWRAANPEHEHPPMYLVRYSGKFSKSSAVRKAKEACLEYEKAEYEAGRLMYRTPAFLQRMTYMAFTHFRGESGHRRFIRIEI